MVFALLLVLFVFVALAVDTAKVCPGKWIEQAKEEPYKGLRKSFVDVHSVDDISSLCPAEPLYSNCFYNGITERSTKLLHRKWVPDNSDSCELFDVRLFLNRIRNRNLYLSGDSITRQLWTSLACSIMAEINIPPRDLHLKWDFYQVPFLYVNNTCPFGALHCFLGRYSSIYIAEYNTTIRTSFEHLYVPDLLIKQMKELKMTSNDIVIINFGIHYTDATSFRSALQLLASDIQDIRNNKHGEVYAKLINNFYYMESTPQHFARIDDNNGYYKKQTAAIWCDPLPTLSPDEVRNVWRTNLVHEILTPANISVIQIADGLESQYDAHVAGDTKLVDFEIADCTHYCSHAGVFKYILTMIQNSIKNSKSTRRLPNVNTHYNVNRTV